MSESFYIRRNRKSSTWAEPSGRARVTGILNLAVQMASGCIITTGAPFRGAVLVARTGPSTVRATWWARCTTRLPVQYRTIRTARRWGRRSATSTRRPPSTHALGCGHGEGRDGAERQANGLTEACHSEASGRQVLGQSAVTIIYLYAGHHVHVHTHRCLSSSVHFAIGLPRPHCCMARRPGFR